MYINTQEELKRAMDKIGLTRYDIAKALHVTPQGVWKWMDGQCPVPHYAGMWFYYEHGITKQNL